MEYILFYNATSGDAAIGAIEGGNFREIANIRMHTGWTHIAALPYSNGLLFFGNANTRGGVIYKAPQYGMVLQKEIPAGSIDPWSQVVGEQRGLYFYDNLSGFSILGVDPKISTRALPTGFTHVIAEGRLPRKLFYNSDTGVAWQLGGAEIFYEEKKAFRPGWTHIAVVKHDNYWDCLLFYNQKDNLMSIGLMDERGYTNASDFTDGIIRPMSPGGGGVQGANPRPWWAPAWTHIVGVSDGFLFLNSSSGAGTFAEIRDLNNGLHVVREYQAGSFASWTHVLRFDA
jgi:hypothetical protein